jgi:myo-inositol-1(or 4)-monophosphatase
MSSDAAPVNGSGAIDRPGGHLPGVDPRPLRDLAVEAAEAAGRFLVDERPDDLGVASTKSTPTDIVTVMDVAAERLIADLIRSRRPDDSFLGEEGSGDTASGGEGDAPGLPDPAHAAASAAAASDVRWVVDPVDGTVNYLYGIPAYGVSIAAEVGGVVVAAAVVNPVLGETFHAVRGEGAWLGERPLRVTGVTDLGQALVATGFGYDAGRRAAQAAVVASLLPQVRDVRRAGAASLDLCAVACGRVDGYYERGLQPWDLAAGGLIAAEAGARVEGLHGAAAGGELVVAAGPGIFTALHDRLAQARADQDG